MSLAGLSGNLADNVALFARAKQRGFQAAANGDLTSSLSEAMATPNDDMFTEALAEQGAGVKDASDMPLDPTSPIPSTRKRGPQQLPPSIQALGS